ncbi:MAG: hypothetical protein C0624_12170 [Desulfuromonas sp.]|nr:MAG: hypothetical protein C0624_12170 [Desulfuromonas sp.]
MKLSELRLSDFGLFASRHFTLSSGVTLLSGANRSGKSLAYRALYSALANRLPEGMTADGDAPPAVAVKLEGVEGAELVERVFRDDPDSSDEPLTGIPTNLLLKAGFWSDGGLLALSPEELAATLRQLSLLDGSDDASPLPQLQREYRGLTSRDPWGGQSNKPGELEQIRERLAEIEFLWEERLDALKRLGALSAESEAVVSSGDTPQPVSESPLVLEKTEDKQSTTEPLCEDSPVEPAPQTVVTFDGEQDWSDGFDDELREIDPRKVRERLWTVQKEAAALRQELVSVPSLSPMLPSFLTLLFLLLSGLLGVFQHDLWQAAGMAGGALILCTWAVFVFLSRNKGSELAGLRERLGAAEAERESLLQELDRLDEQRRYGSSEEIDDEPQGEVTAQPLPVDDVPLPVDDLEQDQAGQDEVAATPPKMSYWQQRRRLLSEVSDLRALEMEGESLRYREQQLMTRIKVLTTAIEMLLQAEENFSGDRRVALAAGIGRQLQDLLPESGLSCELSPSWQLQLKESNGELPLSQQQLSRGEKTLLSLAIHLSLLEQSTSIPLPLIADDLLDGLQLDLRDQALKVLGRFSSSHQLILTSRDPELRTRGASLGWHLIGLDGAAPVKKTKPPVTPERSEDEQQLHLL